MKRSSLFVTAMALTVSGTLGCDNDRDPGAQPPAPPPAEQREMVHEGAIKDSPSDRTGIPATAPSGGRPPGKRADDDVRNSLRTGAGTIEDAADGEPDSDATERTDDDTADSQVNVSEDIVK